MKIPMVIAVDVDGTLEQDGQLDEACLEYLMKKRAEGWSLMLWSSQGQARAAGFADEHGITGIFDVIASKPGLILDDRGWSWTIYCPVVKGVVEVREYKKPAEGTHKQ